VLGVRVDNTSLRWRFLCYDTAKHTFVSSADFLCLVLSACIAISLLFASHSLSNRLAVHSRTNTVGKLGSGREVEGRRGD